MKFTKIFLLLLLPVSIKAQQLPDSTRSYLQNASGDSIKYRATIQAYAYFEERNRDSALNYAEGVILLAQKNNVKLQEARGLDMKGYQLSGKGLYAEALPCFIKAFEISEDPKNESNKWFSVVLTPEKSRLIILSLTHHMYAVLMGYTQNPDEAILHNKEAKKLAEAVGGIPGKQRIFLADMNMGARYLELNKPDSTLIYLEEARDIAMELGDKKYLGYILAAFGDAFIAKENKLLGKKYYDEALQVSTQQGNVSTLSRLYFKLSNYYVNEKIKDSGLLYALKMQDAFRSLGPVISTEVNAGTVYEVLFRSYSLQQQPDSALKYANLSLVAKDSVNKKRMNSLAAFQSLSLREQQRLQRLEKEKTVYQNKIRLYTMLSGLAVVLIIAIILYRSNSQKQRSNKVLQTTLTDLRSTQSQLIQSEKMASLGELTAGIAHEIQNPLNFVNNFSEVSTELIKEMVDEVDKGNTAEVKAIAGDLVQNLEKINHHGKRADAIVKGMLQHSRSNSGTKEPTDINALCDEYLRLSYHGLRAKDKSFNATFKTDLDGSIGAINIVPQDIGRVILNLLTNAFYSVSEKKKQQLQGYEPTVTVSTKKINNKVEIRVKDNGNGVPQKVLDKIFQPFFTTKPTGQGTGLGLSLSYDIVTKGHGGELKIQTKEGEFAEFIITL